MNILKFVTIVPLTILPGTVLAHPGHIESVAGHAHGPLELLLFGIGVTAVCILGLLAVKHKSNG